MTRRVMGYLACGLVVLGIAGCGATHEIGQVVNPVARAADTTAKVPGYRLSGTTAVTSSAASVHGTLSGAVDRLQKAGTLSTTETVGAKTVKVNERFSGLTIYLESSGLSQLKSVTGGKPWLKLDTTRLFGAIGAGSLPTGGSSDPSQFLDYLRAVGAKAIPLGTATIRGLPTTHYRATIDLDHYSRLVAPGQRAAAAKSVSVLEQALGSHSMTMDVWIDHTQKLIRRMSFDFAECVDDQRLHYAMAMDLYDYGPQSPTALPPADQTYDLTPLLASQVSKVKFGCPNAA